MMQLKTSRFSRKRILLLLGGLALVVAVVTALGNQSLDSPGSGISRSDAVQLAWEHSGQGAVTVRSAEIKRDFVTGFDLPSHRWAWVVTFNGHWQLICSGHVTDGSCDPTSQWVAIDYYTGQWIASQFSYPAGR
ncbi:MAG: hypothetical protein M3Z28_13825 [Candidatus Dormibacteraeota bacterium]|nr:hypothetical protein [Candidatus Dormibacteraeota bacterium]